MEKKTEIIVILVLFAFVVVFGEAVITGNSVKEDEKIAIYFPTAADFPNDDSAVISFGFNFPGSGFKVGDKTADLLMFLDSSVIPGLKVGYDTKEKVIYGGLPLIESGKVDIMDGKDHQILYGFDRKAGEQAIILDGNVLAKGEFTGIVEKNLITGFAVYGGFRWVKSPVDIEVSVE